MTEKWGQQYYLEFNELISKFPSPEKTISNYIKNKFNSELTWFNWVDPDKLYFVQFTQNRSNNKTYTGWDHVGKFSIRSMTLTQAAIINIGRYFEVPDEANAVAGIY
ncbi:cytotoxin, partial [Escherichia coli]